jgi:hypothetical protein
MTHTLINRLLNCAAAGFVLAGILAVGASSLNTVMQADLTGQGTLITSLHPSPDAGPGIFAISAADAGVQLALGMLFMLGGMGFYALSVVRSQPIRVIRTRSKRRKVAPNRSLRALKVRSA